MKIMQAKSLVTPCPQEYVHKFHFYQRFVGSVLIASILVMWEIKNRATSGQLWESLKEVYNPTINSHDLITRKLK